LTDPLSVNVAGIYHVVLLTDLAAAGDDSWFIEQMINDVNHSIGRPYVSTHHSGTLTESVQTKHQFIALQISVNKEAENDLRTISK